MSGLLRFALLLALAAVAYLLFLVFIFPGYIAWPEPFHNDMYWAIGAVADGNSFATYLQWPRPVFYETYLLAGHFGLEGSLVFLTAIVVCDLALAVFLFERYVIRVVLPWWLALGTILLMMAAPGFFGQPAFDVGFHLAMLFGFLGIFVWEEYGERYARAALALMLVSFALSALAYEGFVPALCVYGVTAAWRMRRAPALALAIAAVPIFAVALSYLDGRWTHSPVLAIQGAKDYAYRVDLSLQSLAQTARYYFNALVNPAFFVLALACITGLWKNRRVTVAAVLAIAALALYLPYIVLPNHLAVIYLWPPMPLLALVVPLAWIAEPTTTRLRIANGTLILALVATIAFQTTQYPGEKRDFRASLEGNRRIVAALRAHAGQIAKARNVLVRGITLESNPWAHNADAIGQIVPFTGEWWVVTEPGVLPIYVKPNAQPVAPGAVDSRTYDLVLDFDRAGTLVHAQ